jgi:F-type H+-transporting ATPase subunit gamma
MSTINEIKEEIITVKSVGDFANALQQIATARMVKLREKVLASRPFVEEALTMMRELNTLRSKMHADDLLKLEKKRKQEAAAAAGAGRNAVVVITSNQGLTGRYNIEIYQKLEKVVADQPDAEYYVIGKKGQEVFLNGKYKVTSYPYEVLENFTLEDLRRLITLFDYYDQITLVYSRYLNSAKRDVVVTSIVAPELPEDEESQAQPGKYVYEPDIFQLIDSIGVKLRAALFQQQIFDSRLSQYSAQMIGMKTAADNAVELLGDLQLEYNKQRRKMIDKKISEVFAGSALW